MSKINWIGSICIAGVATLLATPNLDGIPNKPRGGDYGAPRLLIEASPDAERQHLSWPKVVATERGTIVVAFIAGQSHHIGGVPAVSISTDGGESFSEIIVIEEFGVDRTPDYAHAANVALGLAANGDLLLHAMAYTPDISGGPRDSKIFGWRSADEGRTWRRTDTSVLDASTGSVYGHIFPVRSGVLGVSGHYRSGSNNNVGRLGGIWMSHSYDDGETWEEPVTISVSNDPLLEPAVIYAAGAYRGLIRLNSANRYRELISYDGKEWRECVSDVGGGEGLPSPFLAADRYRENVLWALHTARNRDGEKGETWLWKREVGSEGDRWERLGLMIEYPRWKGRPSPDFGYPWLAQLNESEWFLVFYYGGLAGKNDLWGMRVRLEPDRSEGRRR